MVDREEALLTFLTILLEAFSIMSSTELPARTNREETLSSLEETGLMFGAVGF